jgi:hypothetical protein
VTLHPAPPDDETGVPGLRTWPRLYGFVVAAFLIWVALLATLMVAFP